MPTSDFASLEETLVKNLPADELNEVWRILYGKQLLQLEIAPTALVTSLSSEFDIAGYTFSAAPEGMRAPRIVRIGAIQNKIVLPTTAPIAHQRDALHRRVAEVIDVASQCGVNVLCLQEAWTMPYAFCTREKQPWCEFAECAETGSTTQLLQQLASMYNMVIISPILERDEAHGDVLFNSAVVISNSGSVLGKARKNHISRVAGLNESMYYMEGDRGHEVFHTTFGIHGSLLSFLLSWVYGKIAVNICYGRHHPLNWLMYGMNGAEIVFNPSAAAGGSSETLWPIEARNAAIANGYFTCAINRVGSETFEIEPVQSQANGGGPVIKESGQFFGSTYVTAPDGTRSPGLSRTRDGLLVCELDLNLCRQVKDNSGFQMTQRLPMYVDFLTKAIAPEFKPQIVRE